MDTLVFQLQAPLSSWGEPAVGEFRGTAEHSSWSALLGLLGAALGVMRDDETTHAALRDSYAFAVGLQQGGSLLRDYHTAQVPPSTRLKGRPRATRRDELSVAKADLSTILSTRDYRQNAASLVAMQVRETGAPPHSLAEVAAALRSPRFVLYLGRKACAPAAPLWPQVVDADSALAAFTQYASLYETARTPAQTGRRTDSKSGTALLEPMPPVTRVYCDEHIVAGADVLLTTRRKDRLIRRQGWQFGDRDERVAFITPSEV
ncbi:MAG: type I-E CRISPR-associated protein Cas5/CasD [Burkholderiales bacterium]